MLDFVPFSFIFFFSFQKQNFLRWIENPNSNWLHAVDIVRINKHSLKRADLISHVCVYVCAHA